MYRKHALILAVAAVATGCQHAGPVTADGFELELEGLRERLNIPGMAAVVARDGEIVWAAGFGLADVGRGEPADTGSIFQLASLTKPFAATVVLQLVDDGLLDLDAPLAEFGIETDDDIRIWHALSHTTGSPPGTAYRYDARLFAELGSVMEAVTGRALAAEVAARVIRPLDLRSTAPNPHDERGAMARSGLDAAFIEERLVTGYAPAWGRRVWPTGLAGPVRPMAHPTAFHASAGLVASAPDVARFAMALDEGRLLSDSLRARSISPIITPAGDTLPHGLGWFVQHHGDVMLVWYYGHWFGSSSLIVRVPEKRLTFVALANSDGLSRWRRLGDHANVLRSPAARAFLQAYVDLDPP
jgi:CubicO group peptidase (beta-lactamase class C family)